MSRIREIWPGIGAKGTTVLPVIPEMQKHANAQVDLKKQKGNLQELMMLYPAVKQKFLIELKICLNEVVTDAVIRGKEEGVFQKVIDPILIAKIITLLFFQFRLHFSFQDEEFERVQLMSYLLIIKGCLTDKGREEWENIKSEISV